jgi:hypothetical protein
LAERGDLKQPKTPASPEAGALEALRAGYRERDAAKVMSAYAEDIESTIVNRNNPPARPLVLRGHVELRKMVDDICSREMTHEIVAMTTGPGAIAYRVNCRYPDGCNVVGVYLATVKDGRIVSEFSVDCWDE